MATKSDIETIQSELKAEVGAISSAWAQAEFNMTLVLAALLKTKIPLAVAVLSTLSGNKARRDIILNVARIALESEHDWKATEKLIQRISRGAKRRNQIAHGLITLHPEHPDKLTIMSTSATANPAQMHYQVFSLKELQAITQRFDDLATDTFSLAQRLHKAKRAALPGTRM